MNTPLSPDPEIQEELRAHLPSPENDAPDWGDLHARIMATAELPLARRRVEQKESATVTPLRPARRRTHLVAMAAAAVAASVVFGVSPMSSFSPFSPFSPSPLSTVEQGAPTASAVEEALLLGMGLEMGALYGADVLDEAALLEIALETN